MPISESKKRIVSIVVNPQFFEYLEKRMLLLIVNLHFSQLFFGDLKIRRNEILLDWTVLRLLAKNQLVKSQLQREKMDEREKSEKKARH